MTESIKSVGFTFIEVMIAIVIVSVASYGLMLGAVHARGELRALEIRERATEELLSFMEELKGRVADGKLSSYERSGNIQGEPIFLLGDEKEPDRIPAKLFYDPIIEEPADSTGNIDRYRLRAWITWQDYSTKKQVVKSREIEMVMMEFPL